MTTKISTIVNEEFLVFGTMCAKEMGALLIQKGFEYLETDSGDRNAKIAKALKSAGLGIGLAEFKFNFAHSYTKVIGFYYKPTKKALKIIETTK